MRIDLETFCFFLSKAGQSSQSVDVVMTGNERRSFSRHLLILACSPSDTFVCNDMRPLECKNASQFLNDKLCHHENHSTSSRVAKFGTVSVLQWL